MYRGEVGRRSSQECCPTASSYQIDAVMDVVVTFQSLLHTCRASIYPPAVLLNNHRGA